MLKRQRKAGECRFTTRSTKLADRSNKRFSSLCVRKAAKWHFHVSFVPFLILQPKVVCTFVFRILKLQTDNTGRDF